MRWKGGSAQGIGWALNEEYFKRTLFTDAAVAGVPPCAQYGYILKDLVKKYGGGAGAPKMKDLELISKKYGANKKLGEDFLCAVVKTEFGSMDELPNVKHAGIDWLRIPNL